MNTKKHISKLYYFGIIYFLMLISCKKDIENPITTVMDIDSNVYSTINIGTQTWMIENLKTTRYRDGQRISYVVNNNEWNYVDNQQLGAFCNYDFSVNYHNVYGNLYNWYAAKNELLCPEGWHVPKNTEWQELITFLGGNNVAGGKLKDARPYFWQQPNNDATNESRFFALPGGRKEMYGQFLDMGVYGYYWSIHATGYYNGNSFALNKQNGFINQKGFPAKTALSVRCIKDKTE